MTLEKTANAILSTYRLQSSLIWNITIAERLFIAADSGAL